MMYDPLWVQEALSELGYLIGSEPLNDEDEDEPRKPMLDGYVARKTRQGMQAFKAANGLKGRPHIGPKTLAALEAAVGRKMPKQTRPKLAWIGKEFNGETIPHGELFGALVTLEDGRVGSLLAVDHDARLYRLQIDKDEVVVDCTGVKSLGPIVSVEWPKDYPTKGIPMAPWEKVATPTESI